MRRCFASACALLGSGLLATAALSAEPTATGIAPGAVLSNLSWLAGCWERSSGDRIVEEQWMVPRGGMMLGIGRTVVGGAAREYEQMRIHEEGGRVVFTSHPSGQTEASFVSIELSPSRVVFENPAHDFPQRVIYALAEDGSLRARIEGKQDGKEQGVDFPMRRAACPSAGTR